MEKFVPSGQPPAESLREHLARRAAEAAAGQAEIVRVATEHYQNMEQGALGALANIAEEMHGQPAPSPNTLGPLWPGN
jgi:hypothetical protein